MTRDQALHIIQAHREELQRDYAVKSLALFGPTARNEATETSDVDVLVEFSKPVGMFHFLRVQKRLQDWLGRKVDLATRAALKSALRERILRGCLETISAALETSAVWVKFEFYLRKFSAHTDYAALRRNFQTASKACCSITTNPHI